ncbi:MAG: YidC/Oxa1 family membrane protein insertase, partial [Algoriphagus sp.]
MDKNQATGLILFAAVILIYSLFFASSPEIPVEDIATITQTDAPSSAVPTQEFTENSLLQNDSLINEAKISKYGVIAAMTIGDEEEIILENELIQVKVSTKGALIKEVILKEYNSWDMAPLDLLSEKSSQMNFIVDSKAGPINLNDL